MGRAYSLPYAPVRHPGLRSIPASQAGGTGSGDATGRLACESQGARLHHQPHGPRTYVAVLPGLVMVAAVIRVA